MIKRIREKDEKNKRLKEQSLKSVPINSDSVTLTAGSPIGIVKNKINGFLAKTVQRSVQQIMLSNRLALKYNKLKYNKRQDKIQRKLKVFKQLPCNKLLNKFSNDKNKRPQVFNKQLSIKLDPRIMRIYNTRIRLDSKFRLEENIFRRRGRLPNEEWNRLKYINDRKIFTNIPHILYKSISRNEEYNVFLSQTRLNTFLTLTNTAGEVILSRSAGWCGISSKKKKKSSDAFRAICERFATDCVGRNIKTIAQFFTGAGCSLYTSRHAMQIFNGFKLSINKFVLVRSKPHSDTPKLRKLRRI